MNKCVVILKASKNAEHSQWLWNLAEKSLNIVRDTDEKVKVYEHEIMKLNEFKLEKVAEERKLRKAAKKTK